MEGRKQRRTRPRKRSTDATALNFPSQVGWLAGNHVEFGGRISATAWFEDAANSLSSLD
jgi:hypothetical protein